MENYGIGIAIVWDTVYIHNRTHNRRHPIPSTLPVLTYLSSLYGCSWNGFEMGRIVPPFRQLYQETVSELEMELRAALVDLGHKSAFDLLLKEAWNPELAALGNSSLPTVCDKLNVMSTIHLRKLIATLVRENQQRDSVIQKLEERIVLLEQILKELGKGSTALTPT